MEMGTLRSFDSTKWCRSHGGNPTQDLFRGKHSYRLSTKPILTVNKQAVVVIPREPRMMSYDVVLVVPNGPRRWDTHALADEQ